MACAQPEPPPSRTPFRVYSVVFGLDALPDISEKIRSRAIEDVLAGSMMTAASSASSTDALRITRIASKRWI